MEAIVPDGSEQGERQGDPVTEGAGPTSWSRGRCPRNRMGSWPGVWSSICPELCVQCCDASGVGEVVSQSKGTN